MTAKSAQFFQDCFDRLPDRDVNPPEADGPYHHGDLCKVKGRAVVRVGGEWVDAETFNNRRHGVQV